MDSQSKPHVLKEMPPPSPQKKNRQQLLPPPPIKKKISISFQALSPPSSPSNMFEYAWKLAEEISEEYVKALECYIVSEMVKKLEEKLDE